jgi:aspartokinase/homoserine dehydrogenase 1
MSGSPPSRGIASAPNSTAAAAPDAAASARVLFPVLYRELRWLARSKLAGGGRPTLLDTSALVHEAHALGYTEPDPRDDLSGTDVARKLVILAREAGVGLELGDVAVESLVPASLRTSSAEDFMRRLSEFDAAIAERHARAHNEGRVLRYVAKLDRERRASVGLAELPRDHAFAHLRLTDNIVQFGTRRYRDNPLVVQGPGAGPEVTAAGVFADLLRVASSLGARV